jgi:hypothetical protein
MKEKRFNKRGTDKGSNEKTQAGSGAYQLTKVLKPSACKPETLYRVCIQDTCIFTCKHTTEYTYKPGYVARSLQVISVH